MVPSQPGVGRRSGAFLCCGARGGAAWQELGSRLLRCSSARKELACPPQCRQHSHGVHVKDSARHLLALCAGPCGRVLLWISL